MRLQGRCGDWSMLLLAWVPAVVPGRMPLLPPDLTCSKRRSFVLSQQPCLRLTPCMPLVWPCFFHDHPWPDTLRSNVSLISIMGVCTANDRAGKQEKKVGDNLRHLVSSFPTRNVHIRPVKASNRESYQGTSRTTNQTKNMLIDPSTAHIE